MTTLPNPISNRVSSIDVLRGFDMFFLTGGMAIMTAAIKWIYGSIPAWYAYHSTHVAWEGFAAWDLVMPLFIFIVGTAMPYSLGKMIGNVSPIAIYWRIIRRVVLLFLVGMAIQGNLLSFQLDRIHPFCNTLHAIAGGYFIASLCIMYAKRTWYIPIALILLVIEAAALCWIPFDGHPAGTIQPHCNVALFIDHYLLGSFQDGTNYAWILPQLSFGALTLIGVWAGDVLKCSYSAVRKLVILLVAGGICLGLGALCGQFLPIIKHLFTSSMVLWAAGWSLLLLALCHAISDILKLETFFFPFKVIGSNAILAYSWYNLCPPSANISQVLFSGFASCFGSASELIFQICNYALFGSILYYLYRNKTFIKL